MLGRLLSAFPERDLDEGAQAERLRGYVIACEGLPLSTLIEAERRILRGEVEDINPTFMPTPPELARLCRAIAAEERFRTMPARATAMLERFEAPADPNIVLKFERVGGALAKTVDIESHETKAEWLQRMGPRVKLLEPPE